MLAITPARAAAEAPSRASLGMSSSTSSTSMGAAWPERGALCGPADEPGSCRGVRVPSAVHSFAVLALT